MAGPSLPFCDHLHATKYRDKGETFSQFAVRFTTALTEGGLEYNYVIKMIADMRFMAAGRVQAWAGSKKIVTPFNCYASAVIHDSFVDGPRVGEDQSQVSIMKAATQAAQTMRQGGGIGYDFSTLRPSGSIIKGVDATSDGPLAFMPVFNAVCEATSSAGNRRGAQMAVLRCDHPDIEKFITMKTNNNVLNGFNVSVGVTDELMEAVARKSTFDLRFNGRVVKTVDAEALWDLIMRTTWDWAEPGVLFIDTINRQNNLWYCETIATTNPCGEQPLPPFGACLLGSHNLTRYLVRDLLGHWEFDYELLEEDVGQAVRVLDRVIDLAKHPLIEQELEAKNKRRMGIGVTGMANTLEALGHPYGSAAFCYQEEKILTIIRNAAYRESIRLAKELGSFPLFNADLFCKSKFVKTLPDDIQAGIRKFGIRNSHLLSIAPTGTISFVADNVSSSIEPVFSLEAERPVKMPEGDVVVNVQDYGYATLGVKGKTTATVTVQEHVDVLLTAAKLVDSAVSKTVNVQGTTPWAEFTGIYTKAYEGGAKGCTTFNKDGRRHGLLVDGDGRQTPVSEAGNTGLTCMIDKDGRKSCE